MAQTRERSRQITERLNQLGSHFAGGNYQVDLVQGKNFLRETRDILQEIENEITLVEVGRTQQGYRNKACIGGVIFGLAGTMMATTPPSQMLAVGTGIVSFLGYLHGKLNASKFQEALSNLEIGRTKARSIEGELLQYTTRLEMKLHGI